MWMKGTETPGGLRSNREIVNTHKTQLESPIPSTTYLKPLPPSHSPKPGISFPPTGSVCRQWKTGVCMSGGGKGAVEGYWASGQRKEEGAGSVGPLCVPGRDWNAEEGGGVRDPALEVGLWVAT